MDAFNDCDHEKVCDLFAPNLAAMYRGVPDRAFAQLWAHLRQVLSEPDRRYRYSLEVGVILWPRPTSRRRSCSGPWICP